MRSWSGFSGGLGTASGGASNVLLIFRSRDKFITTNAMLNNQKHQVSWNTCSEFTAQYASVNALGVFITYSAHVGARVEHSEAAQTSDDPAQLPQRVRSKMIDML